MLGRRIVASVTAVALAVAAPLPTLVRDARAQATGAQGLPELGDGRAGESLAGAGAQARRDDHAAGARDRRVSQRSRGRLSEQPRQPAGFASRDARQDFEFFAVPENSINAFAARGFIGVNSGLILLAQSESELASVLAHEITHDAAAHRPAAAEPAEQHADVSRGTRGGDARRPRRRQLVGRRRTGRDRDEPGADDAEPAQLHARFRARGRSVGFQRPRPRASTCARRRPS